MISLFVLFTSWLAVVDRWQCGAIGLLGTLSSWSPPPTPHPFILSLVSCMKLASCPGQGLCLSHARLDLRHFIALTLPPTVTAALNEATHMCLDQVRPEPGVQPDDERRPGIFNMNAPVFQSAPMDSVMSAWCFYIHREVRARLPRLSQCIKQTMVCPQWLQWGLQSIMEAVQL